MRDEIHQKQNKTERHKRKREPRTPTGKRTHLQALDQRGLLSADIRARPSVQVHVEVVPGAARVLAQEPFLRTNGPTDQRTNQPTEKQPNKKKRKTTTRAARKVRLGITDRNILPMSGCCSQKIRCTAYDNSPMIIRRK